MDLHVKISMNEKLFIKDPKESELGRKILQNSIILIHKLGYESFTFKKLAKEIHTTEAGVYRYFENKHRLLLYIVDWYWCWQEYRMVFLTHNLKDPFSKIKKVVEILIAPDKDLAEPSHYMNEKLIHEIVVYEGAKVYLTKNITEDNKAKLFKPYKDLCNKIANIFLEVNPDFKYPRSLATIIIEMSHSLKFYNTNLPSLTDFNTAKAETKIGALLEDLIFSNLKETNIL